MEKITSSFLTVDFKDALKGLIVAVGAAVFALVSESIVNNKFTFDFTAIWHTAVAAGVAYIGKQFFTPAKVVVPAE